MSFSSRSSESDLPQGTPSSTSEDVSPGSSTDGEEREPIVLSDAESTELLRHIGELAQAGLPLDRGLEAFAQEVSQPKLRSAFQYLAEELRAGSNPLLGQDFNFVRLPPYHQRMLVAGIQSQRLGETLYELLEEENWRVEYRRDLWAALSYPLVLAVVTLIVVDLLNVLIMPMVQSQFLDIYREFDLDLSFDPEIFQSPPVSWISFIALGGLGLFLIPAVLTPAQAAMLRRSMPLVGKIYWWYDTLDLVMKLRLLVAQKVAVPAALELLSGSMASRHLEQAVAEWREEMRRGKSLGQVWQNSPDIPSSILPLVRWGEANSALEEAFRSAEELLKERLALRRELIRKIAPPIMTTIVLAALFWASIRLAVLVSPLVDLIRAMS